METLIFFIDVFLVILLCVKVRAAEKQHHPDAEIGVFSFRCIAKDKPILSADKSNKIRKAD